MDGAWERSRDSTSPINPLLCQYPEAITGKLCEDDDACDDPGDDPGVPGESAFNEQVLRADPERAYSDDAWWVTYKHWQREWFFIGRCQDVGEDFRGDTGFIRRVGQEVHMKLSRFAGTHMVAIRREADAGMHVPDSGRLFDAKVFRRLNEVLDAASN